MLSIKKTAARILSCAAVLACMAVIFAFSGQSAPESSELSGSLIARFAPLLCAGYYELSGAEQAAVVESLQSAVRTAAHGAVYCLLGILTATALYSFELKAVRSFLTAVLICLLYAVSDEIHQYFVPGRSMQLIDIAVDFAGSAAGAGALAAVRNVLPRKKRPVPS